MGSGLIYAVIIVMWAAYFIPRWLRRHEELSEARSVERFDHAMRILSRSKPIGDKGYAMSTPRPPQPTGHDGDIRGTGAVPAQRSRPRPAAVSPVAMRRRRVLAGLLLATLVSTLLVPLSPVPWWGALLVLAATLGFLVHLRLQVRTTREVSRTRDAVRRRSLSRLVRFDALERLMAVRREMAEDRAAEEQRWADAETAGLRERVAEEERVTEAAGGWSPVPVPLPTYVTKPMAPPRRTAQVEAQPVNQPEQPGETSGRPAPMSALLDDAYEAEGQLEAILGRRAVND